MLFCVSLTLRASWWFLWCVKGFSRGSEQITVYRETMSVIFSTYISVRSNFRFDLKINILSRYEFKNEMFNVLLLKITFVL